MNVQKITMTHGITKGEAADWIYPWDEGYTVDFALPLGWMQSMMEKGFTQDELLCNFVWVYHEKFFRGGFPGPITVRGVELMMRNMLS